MNQTFIPGQTVYLPYWRRPEESELTRVAFYLTEQGRDNANIYLLTWGLITLTATWEIPTPVKGKSLYAKEGTYAKEKS